MTESVIQCPKCKTRYKLKNIEEREGTKIVCKKCQTPIRIRASAPAAKARADEDEDEFGDGGSVEDEFGPAASSAPARLPSRVKRSTKPGTSTLKRPGEAGGKKQATGNADEGSAGSSKALLVVVAVIASVLVLSGLGVGGFFVFRSLGPTKYEAPPANDYVDFVPKDGGITCRIPKDWQKSWGGGQAGQPYWARFGDSRLTIEARESVSGGAMGQAAIAAQQKNDPSNSADSISPAQTVHEAYQHFFAENFDDFHEEPGHTIKTAFGQGWMTDFTAKEGLLKSKVAGCRVTVLNSIHQFTVTFKCSPAMFNDAKPVFEKIVATVGPGTGP